MLVPCGACFGSCDSIVPIPVGSGKPQIHLEQLVPGIVISRASYERAEFHGPPIVGRGLGCALSIGLCVCSTTALGRADEGKPVSTEQAATIDPESVVLRLLVNRFSGIQGNVARGYVLAALEREVLAEVVSIRALESESKEFDGSPRAFASAGNSLALDAFIGGKLTQAETGWALRLTVTAAGNGKVLGYLLFATDDLEQLQSKLRAELWGRLKPLFDPNNGAPPLAPTTKPNAGEPDAVVKREPADETKAPASPVPSSQQQDCDLFRVELGGGTFSRALAYGGESPGPLRGHNVLPVPMARFEIAYAPLVHATCSAWSQLRVRVRYDQVLYVYSELAAQRLRTFASDARGGLSYAMGWPSFYFEPSVDYDWRTLAVDGDILPDFGAHSLRFGAMFGVRIAAVFLEAGGAYHRFLRTGELTSKAWFPLAQGAGYELEGRLGVRLTRSWAILGTANGQSNRFTLHPDPPYGYPHGTAESLEDRILSAQLAVRWTAVTKSGM